jgi:hypothetical protein
VVVLVDVLRENNRLEWLNLSNNNITNDGAGALLELLNDNQTLRRIILDGNEAINQNLINQIRGLLAQRFPLLHNENEELESEIDSEESDFESYQESEEAELEEIEVELEELEKVTNQNGKRTQDNQPSENEDDDREFKKQKIMKAEQEVDSTTIPPASIQEPSGENLVELSKPKSPMHE